jgi:tetratricopeptide (TPR) repeat protein
LALFGKKDDPTPSDNGGPHEFSPEKAARFFQHARTVHDTGNFEYAIQSYLNGLRFDPQSMTGLTGLFQSCAAFLGEKEGRSVSKDVFKSVGGKSELDRYLLSLLEWGMKPTDPSMALRAFEYSARMGLTEPAAWIGERALGACLREKKPVRDRVLKCAQYFQKVGALNQAVAAAEQALKINPTDGEVAQYVRQLAAQATMNRGGYDRSGQEGGFRQNIRDADKQRQIEESERIVKSDETKERLIAAAEADLQNRPDDTGVIDKLGKLLLERGRPADEERAHGLYTHAFEVSKTFRWRELAGTIRMRQSRRKVVELRRMLEQSPGNEMLTRMLTQSEREHAELEAAEYKLQCDAYPTDLTRKFELGKRYMALEMYHEAIEMFQESQHDPRNRPASLSLLGQAFLKIGWNDEGVGALRTALEIKDLLPDVNLEIRYWLMVALQSKAQAERDLEAAAEADRLAASVALQSIGYLDIRTRRDAIKKLVADLKAAKNA